MAASASTQTLEVGEGNRELGKIREDKEGERVFLLSPLPGYIQQNSEYLPNNCSILPHSDSKSGENKSQSRPNTIFISVNADRRTCLCLWMNELLNDKIG